MDDNDWSVTDVDNMSESERVASVKALAGMAGLGSFHFMEIAPYSRMWTAHDSRVFIDLYVYDRYNDVLKIPATTTLQQIADALKEKEGLGIKEAPERIKITNTSSIPAAALVHDGQEGLVLEITNHDIIKEAYDAGKEAVGAVFDPVLKSLGKQHEIPTENIMNNDKM